MTASVAIPYTRVEHRLSLKYKTNQKMTGADDLDYYINKAEVEVLAEFMTFHPGLQRQARTSDTTDASGILLVDQGFIGLERLEDSNKGKYNLISSIDDVWNRTGYIFCGFDATVNKHKLQVFSNNSVLASTTLYWWNLKLICMGAGTTAESAIPYGFKEAIDYLAAKKYWEDQGQAPQGNQAKYFAGEYDKVISKARDRWENASIDPEWTSSDEPDSGQYGNTFIHTT